MDVYFGLTLPNLPVQSSRVALDGMCTGSVSIAVDNAYVLYINGFVQRTGHSLYNVAGCDGTSFGAVNHAGDPYTGCNWQSVDLIGFAAPAGEVVFGIDALDAGGVGGLVATVTIDGHGTFGDVYPSNAQNWKCWEGGDDTHGEGGGSQVDSAWHGVDGPSGWELPGFDDSAWPAATSLGTNGVGPWGDVNRDMGMESKGTISADSEWIWTKDENLHNDIFCRMVVQCGTPPPPPPICSGSVSVAVDNAYVLYLNGFPQLSGHQNFNVEGCEQDDVSGGAVNHAGDHYTGCNWQSVDMIRFDQPGPVVIGIDALDAGGIGGLIATVRIDGGAVYPSNTGWKCWEGGAHGGDDGDDWSQVSGNWHGIDGPNGWELPGFPDYTWQYAKSLGVNGVGPWGDINRDMEMDSKGVISADSEWIWTADENLHNDIFCRLEVCNGKPPPPLPCSGSVSLAVDNAYVLYINGHAQPPKHSNFNVQGCEQTALVAGAVNHAGDHYTGCNWQSIDLFDFAVPGPRMVVGIDALDAGGVGGLIATVNITGGAHYPSNAGWKCWEGGDEAHGEGGGSVVDTAWHGIDGPNGWELPGYDDSAWENAKSLGANGVGPWGDINRDMGGASADKTGVITSDSEWIWTADENLHNDIFCRLVIECGEPPPPPPSCVGSVSLAVDNAYVLYLNGDAQSSGHQNFNVVGCEQDDVSGGAVNHAGDHYTGCNWQSVDLIEFDTDGPLVIGIDALDAGGMGGLIATVVANGQVYPSTSAGSWKCWEGGAHSGDDDEFWSEVSGNWHGIDGPNGWELPSFDDSQWQWPKTLGRNGVGPWGDINRDMGMDSKGTITDDSEWIWTSDENLHNDIFCRLVVCDGSSVVGSGR